MPDEAEARDENTPDSPKAYSVFEKVVLFVCSLLFGIISFVALRTTIFAPDQSVRIKEWIAFYQTSLFFWEGSLDLIYTSHRSYLGFPYFYPPFSIYLWAPLAAIPVQYVHAAMIGYNCIFLTMALWVLKRFVKATRAQWILILIVVWSSPALWGILVVGQYATLHVLIVGLAFMMWKQRKDFAAGFFFALLSIKPNLGLVFWLLCLLKRKRMMIAGLVTGFAVLFVISLPLGIDRWFEFLRHVSSRPDMVRSHFEAAWKHQTLFVFWWSLMGAEASFVVVDFLWGASVLFLGVLLLLSWRGENVEAYLSRLCALTVLFVVSCNPYLFFYDGVLLTIPAIIWYAKRSTYTSKRCYCLSGAMIVGVYATQFATLLVIEVLPLVGVFAAVWMIAESTDLIRGRKEVLTK